MRVAGGSAADAKTAEYKRVWKNVWLCGAQSRRAGQRRSTALPSAGHRRRLPHGAPLRTVQKRGRPAESRDAHGLVWEHARKAGVRAALGSRVRAVGAGTANLHNSCRIRGGRQAEGILQSRAALQAGTATTAPVKTGADASQAVPRPCATTQRPGAWGNACRAPVPERSPALPGTAGRAVGRLAGCRCFGLLVPGHF